LNGISRGDRLEDSPMRNSPVGYKPTVPFRETYGANTTEEVEQQFKLLAEKCKSTKKYKLLLDFTEVPANISLVDRYELGKRTLVFARHKCKVAAVCKSEHRESVCFLATVAQNRWVDLCIFTNVEDAVEWLLKE
jgi:hypothetical protein